MIDIENKLFESLNLCKAELLNGVPKEDQVDLILGFLSSEKIWLNMIIEDGEENFLRLYENDKKIRKKCLNDMEVEEKMLYYHADTILDKMWKTNSYIVKQQENHQLISISTAKKILKESIALFDKCKPYSKNHRVWALYWIMKHLKKASPLAIPYIEYTFYKLKKQGKMPKDANCYHFK